LGRVKDTVFKDLYQKVLHRDGDVEYRRMYLDSDTMSLEELERFREEQEKSVTLYEKVVDNDIDHIKDLLTDLSIQTDLERFKVLKDKVIWYVKAMYIDKEKFLEAYSVCMQAKEFIRRRKNK